MRIFTTRLILSAMMVVLGSSTASALDITTTIAGIFTDSSLTTPAGNYMTSDGGATGTADLAPGQTILVNVTVDNALADPITAIFTTLIHEGSQLQLLGFQLPTNMLLEPGFGGAQLSNVNTGALKGNSPNLDDGSGGDVWIQAVSYALQAGTTGTGPDTINLLYVVQSGVSASDELLLTAGETQGDAIAGASVVNFGSASINVPEPGALGLAFASLGTVGLLVRVRRRD